LARSVRAAIAAGAESVKLDPATGVFTFVLPGKADAATTPPADSELR